MKWTVKQCPMKQVCVEPRPSVVNALAAERRRLQLRRGAGARSYRSISPACPTFSSKPASCRSMAKTGGRTDGRTLDRYIDTAPHTMRAVSIKLTTVGLDVMKTSVKCCWLLSTVFYCCCRSFSKSSSSRFLFFLVFLLFVFFVPCAILNRLTVTLSACKYYIVSYRIVSCLCTTWLEISNVKSIILDAAIYARQCWFPVLRGCLKRAIFLLSFLSSQAYCQAVRSLVIICEQLWNLIRPL